MLLDVLEAVGLDGMAQVDLDTHLKATNRCSSSAAWPIRCSHRSRCDLSATDAWST